ncbi:hypothetical protein K458DRAFT_399306 [Lentithecium fluviatile CBS 122367]|uniref:BHLH domain-containing protein n=1 Tax=Lentithecium fluviatile CBS 122367 TaxID=1168545 RepID=A0A6G1JI02_9PLEO|nr:hypothetical protein K458DRAFT_399306 [Lentithecium fluviatile CBS 122367]
MPLTLRTPKTMDCSDPTVLTTDCDCSPTDESFYPSVFDACFADTYTAQPILSLEFPAGFVQKYQVVSSGMRPLAANANLSQYRPASFSTSFDQEQFESGFPFGTGTDELCCFDPESGCGSPCAKTPSPLSSLGSDGTQAVPSCSPDDLPPPTLKRETSPPAVRPRKRGRPRLDRTSASPPFSSTSPKSQRTTRVPHNQVERKYREGLNWELERLRRTVPTLPQCAGGRAVGQPNLSKAMVLVGAIEHIKTVEGERDALVVENERLRDRIACAKRRKEGDR